MTPETAETLAASLEREHQEIDTGIELFLAARAGSEEAVKPLERTLAALRRHIFLEEEFLFPPLRAAGLFAPIFVMLREHGEIWKTMDTIQGQLNGGSGGPSDEHCRELLALLVHHNAKEEAVIYPHADTILTTASHGGLLAFLATGRMPDGWTCAQAQA